MKGPESSGPRASGPWFNLTRANLINRADQETGKRHTPADDPEGIGPKTNRHPVHHMNVHAATRPHHPQRIGPAPSRRNLREWLRYALARGAAQYVPLWRRRGRICTSVGQPAYHQLSERPYPPRRSAVPDSYAAHADAVLAAHESVLRVDDEEPPVHKVSRRVAAGEFVLVLRVHGFEHDPPVRRGVPGRRREPPRERFRPLAIAPPFREASHLVDLIPAPDLEPSSPSREIPAGR